MFFRSLYDYVLTDSFISTLMLLQTLFIKHPGCIAGAIKDVTNQIIRLLVEHPTDKQGQHEVRMLII